MTSTVPPVKVQHTIHLLPPHTTINEQEQVTAMLHTARSTFTYSAHAAHAIAFAGTLESQVVVWNGSRWQDDIYEWLRQRGVSSTSREFDATTPANAGHNLGSTPRTLATPEKILHTIHLLPQDITLAELNLVTKQLYPTQSAFTYSADAAHALVDAGNEQSEVIIWSGERWSANIYHWCSDRGIKYQSQRIDTVGGSDFLLTRWPTQFKTITQRFMENPQDYQMNDLKGHDGLDIVAPEGTPIVAAADGVVYRIVRDPQDNHNYGNGVFLRHRDGYRTAYGHLKSIDSSIVINRVVQAGDLLGTADSTGNSRGSHLHLTLYLDGATLRHETPQPWDLIDPEPYLRHLLDGPGSVWPQPKEPLISGWGYAPSMEIKDILAKVVAPSYINFRTAPMGGTGLIGRINNGVVVRITGPQENNFYPIKVSDGDVQKTTTISTFELGLHNENGAEWMLANNVKGWALHTVAVGNNKVPIDATRFALAGIKVLVRLNYGYGSTGNIPRDNDPDYPKFVQACIDTINQSRGVWGFILGNETNNAAEFPGNQNGVGGEAITPERYARLYNRIWNMIPQNARMAPQAVDPYFDPQFILNIDSREYWRRILDNIAGAEFLTLHPKTQDSDPASIDSDRTFGAGPLSWQYYHMKAYQPLLDVVPSRFRGLPVIATEVNPQRHNNGTTLGWQTELGAEWVRRSVTHFKAYNVTAVMPIAGVIYYRFSDDDWAFNHKPDILAAIKEAARGV